MITKTTDRIWSFEPIVDPHSDFLILGSIPGPESLRKGQYYGNPQTHFWRIIYSAFDEQRINSAYDEKIRFLLDHKIAVWDVFRSADRKGAMDADIKSEEPNDIPGLIRAFPGIKRILAAGKKAELSLRKYFPDIAVDIVYVPSASPAYARKPLEDKVKDWKNALTL